MSIRSAQLTDSAAIERLLEQLGYNDSVRGQGIGREMEEYVIMLAKERGCDRVEVHCHERRVDAHRFYFRQGFEESPKYLMKRLL